MNTITQENQLKKLIYLQATEEIGVAVIYTEDWVQPETDEDIVRTTSFMANVFTSALLKSQETGKQHFDVVVKMDKFKVRNINYKFVKYLTSILKQLFPERLRRATLLDPPKFFITAYDIIKTFLDKPTRKKFQLISSADHNILYQDVVES